MDEQPIHGRGVLMAPYEHPYRHALAVTWHDELELRALTAAVVAGAVAGAAGEALGIPLLGVLGGLAALLTLPMLLMWVVALVRRGWRVTRSWREDSELAPVRARRPHAGEADPDVAHEEFAVSAEEDGQLVTWCFRPLVVSEDAGELEIEVPGRPRYAASVVAEEPFDPDDTVRAAEQLVAAQARAAVREAEAAAAARAAVDDESMRFERAAETRTTAAALQRATGQRRPPD